MSLPVMLLGVTRIGLMGFFLPFHTMNIRGVLAKRAYRHRSVHFFTGVFAVGLLCLKELFGIEEIQNENPTVMCQILRWRCILPISVELRLIVLHLA